MSIACRSHAPATHRTLPQTYPLIADALFVCKKCLPMLQLSLVRFDARLGVLSLFVMRILNLLFRAFLAAVQYCAKEDVHGALPIKSSFLCSCCICSNLSWSSLVLRSQNCLSSRFASMSMMKLESMLYLVNLFANFDTDAPSNSIAFFANGSKFSASQFCCCRSQLPLKSLPSCPHSCEHQLHPLLVRVAAQLAHHHQDVLHDWVRNLRFQCSKIPCASNQATAPKPGQPHTTLTVGKIQHHGTRKPVNLPCLIPLDVSPDPTTANDRAAARNKSCACTRSNQLKVCSFLAARATCRGLHTSFCQIAMPMSLVPHQMKKCAQSMLRLLNLPALFIHGNLDMYFFDHLVSDLQHCASSAHQDRKMTNPEFPLTLHSEFVFRNCSRRA